MNNNAGKMLNRFRSRSLPLLFLLSCLAGCTQTGPILSPTQPHSPEQLIGVQFLEAMDKAYVNKDAAALSGLLQDDFIYTVSTSVQGGPPQELALTKPAWMEAIVQNFSMASDYSIERSDIQVSRLDDVTLLLTSRYRESATMQGLRVSSNGEETITLAVTGDSVLASEISAEIVTTIRPN